MCLTTLIVIFVAAGESVVAWVGGGEGQCEWFCWDFWRALTMEVEVSGAPAEKNFDVKGSDVEKYHNATNSTSWYCILLKPWKYIFREKGKQCISVSKAIEGYWGLPWPTTLVFYSP